MSRVDPATSLILLLTGSKKERSSLGSSSWSQCPPYHNELKRSAKGVYKKMQDHPDSYRVRAKRD